MKKYTAENLNEFVRGQNPKQSMGIGLAPKIMKWIEEEFYNAKDKNVEITDEGRINMDSVNLWNKTIPEYIKFGTIRGRFFMTGNKIEKSSLPEKVLGDFEFYQNSIRFRTEEKVRELIDVKGEIILVSDEMLDQREYSKTSRERGPVNKRTTHKYPDTNVGAKPNTKIYSKGYKTYKLLEWMKRTGPKTYSEIIDFLYEMRYEMKRDRKRAGGHYSGMLRSPGHNRTAGPLHNKVEKDPKTGKYTITNLGQNYLDKNQDKFEDGKNYDI